MNRIRSSSLTSSLVVSLLTCVLVWNSIGPAISPVYAEESQPATAGEQPNEQAVTAAALEADDLLITVDSSANVVINEIFTDPLNKTEAIEFVELFNTNSFAVDLSNWMLEDGVEYNIPAGVVIPAGGFLLIAQNPTALRNKYGVDALGPFEGKLNNDGDHLVLRNANAEAVDEVQYGLGFPWPTVGDAPERSLQLQNPTFENAWAGAWRSERPTPGGWNVVYTDNPAPNIETVNHTPRSPTSNTTVRITAQLFDSDGIAAARIYYQVVEPGNYIAQSDPAYASQWTPIEMTSAGNDLYVADLPAQINQHRRLVRYRVQAVDSKNMVTTVPYADDPQSNFAYFVYDGVPTWTAALGQGDPPQTFDFGAMRPLPIYQLISKRSEVQDAQFIPDSPFTSGYMGHDFIWQGALVYNGEVYDHIHYRARGGTWRYGMGKNMWKFDFNRGHWFQAINDFGQPYATKWDKLNLGAVVQQSARLHRGEQGLFESVGFRLFRIAGVEAPRTHFIHFRVIDENSEQGWNQYNGDFWGLYLAVEQYDGNFLDEHGLPDGNLYKMEQFTGDLENQSPFGPTNKSDLNWFLDQYNNHAPDSTWWRRNFDLNRYFSFRSIVEAIHHYDVGSGKNYYYFINPETRQWSIHPWDIDQTWAENMIGDGDEPFYSLVAQNPAFTLEYQNRMREIRDLLFNPEEVNRMIDEHANLIDNASNGLSMVDADRMMWDYNPIFRSRYVSPLKTAVGQYYKRAADGTFRGMAELMKTWVLTRGSWIDARIINDPQIPQTPWVGYSGAPGFPADGLRFQSADFVDPQGNQTFGAMQWRIAEIVRPGLPTYNPNAPQRYEMQATWESARLSAFTGSMTPPVGVIQPGRTYRVRVRMQDNTGRWSHWSPPMEFTAGAPSTPAITTIKISEIMYHPHTLGPLNDTKLEFIELKNIGSDPINLSGMRIVDGIDYVFPGGTTLGPGLFLVLASNRIAFATRYGFAPFAEYDRHLSNAGDRVSLVDSFGRTLFSVAYSDDATWGEAADGGGSSLVPLAPDANIIEPDNAASWRVSTAIHGSPGADDPLPVVINEILAHVNDGQMEAIELYNPTTFEAAIGGWYLSDNPALPKKFKIPAGTLIPAGGFVSFSADAFNAQPGDAHSFDLADAGETLYLSSANQWDRLTGYMTAFEFGAAEPGVSLGRVVNSVGRVHITPQSATSLGAVNAGPRIGPIIISRIMYNPQSGIEFIELQNSSDAPVPLYDPERPLNTWRLGGVIYQFPSGITIPAQGKLLVTPLSPTTVCTTVGVAPGTQVIGPYPVNLADDGQLVALEKPSAPDSTGQVHYIIVDAIEYDDVPPWPFEPDGTGPALARTASTAYGNDPANWLAGDGSLQTAANGANSVAGVGLCSFEVFVENGQLQVHWMTAQEENVSGYYLWRSTDGQRASAERITPDLVPVQQLLESRASYAVADISGQIGTPYFYWLQAVHTDGAEIDVAFTTPRQPVYQVYLPEVGR